MNNHFLLSKYRFYRHHYLNIHSAGPEIIFTNPVIGYLKKGTASFLYNGKTFFAEEGDLIYISYRTKYQSIWYGTPNIKWYQVDFDFVTKSAFNDYRFQILKKYPADIFDKMHETYDTFPLQSLSYFYLLLDDIYTKMEKSSPPVYDSSINPAINYIENNYNAPLSISSLAELCHISKSALFDKFKRLYGVSPITYKHSVMVQRAIELLANTDMSIEEISAATGFSSSNYFRRIFQKFTEQTPKELRKK